MNEFILQALLSFVATACFGVVFNAPTKVIPYCGLIGSVCWSIYYMLTSWKGIEMIQATFVSAFLVAIIAHLLARTRKLPVIVFSVSGIIPLVPGGTAYNTMRDIVEQDYIKRKIQKFYLLNIKTVPQLLTARKKLKLLVRET